MAGLTPLRTVIAGTCLALSAGLGWMAWEARSEQIALNMPDPVILGAGDYVLEGTDGLPFTQATLGGTPSVVFFGFTHCPEICPTTLADIALWQDELGDRADGLRYYFVTVDPERDTAEVLGDYVGWVGNVVGVTGSVEETEKAMEAFRIYAERIPLSDGSYTMDHSSYVMLFNADGSFAEPIGYGEDLKIALRKIERVLRGWRSPGEARG